MKKIIFAVAILSVFTVTSLALAKNSPNMDSFEEVWIAINDLKSQIAGLRTDLKAGQDLAEKPIVTDDFIKVAKDTVAKNKNTPRSEHYMMTGLMIQ